MRLLSGPLRDGLRCGRRGGPERDAMECGISDSRKRGRLRVWRTPTFHNGALRAARVEGAASRNAQLELGGGSAAQAQARNQRLVPRRIVPPQVVEQPAPATHELEKPPA